MAHRIAARGLFSGLGSRPCALERVTAVGLDLPKGRQPRSASDRDRMAAMSAGVKRHSDLDDTSGFEPF
jgi:hypothetical protein